MKMGSVNCFGVPVRCSPFVAASLGATSATMFVAGGETNINNIRHAHVYALDAGTGAYYGTMGDAGG